MPLSIEAILAMIAIMLAENYLQGINFREQSKTDFVKNRICNIIYRLGRISLYVFVVLVLVTLIGYTAVSIFSLYNSLEISIQELIFFQWVSAGIYALFTLWLLCAIPSLAKFKQKLSFPK